MSDSSTPTPAAPRARRRERPDGTAEIVAAGQPDQAAVAANLAKPVIPQQPAAGLNEALQDPRLLAQVMRTLGYGADQQGVQLVDADDDEGGMVEFVRTGWVRFPAPVFEPDQPRRWRLRRPFLGGLRKLRDHYEDASIEIDEARIDYLAADAEHKAAIAEANTLVEPDRSRAKLEANKVRRAAERAMDERIVSVRMEWWALTFRTLCVDDAWGQAMVVVPEDAGDGHVAVPQGWQWGTWVEDPNLPVEVINHWRSVPLGHGG